MPEPHVSVHTRCFLCDDDFPSDPRGRRPLPTLVALFAIDNSVEAIYHASREIVRFIRGETPRMEFWVRGFYYSFERHHPRQPHFINEATSVQEMGDVRKWCGYCVPEKALFFAHDDCWKMAKNHGISDVQLYRFAVQTQPQLPWKGDKPHSRVLALFKCQSLLESGTSLGELLAEISRRLPPELQESILSELRRDARSTEQSKSIFKDEWIRTLRSSDLVFLRCATVEVETVPLLKQICADSGTLDVHPARSFVAPPGSSLRTTEPARTLYIRERELFGRTYISEIGLNQAGHASVPIQPRPVRGLRFAVGRFGLRAIRILYDEGPHSPWLGDPYGSMYGNIMGDKLRNLSVVADKLRVVRVYMSASRVAASNVTDALFDREIDAPPGELLLSTSNHRDDPRTVPRLFTPRYRRWQMFTCLPLKFGSSYSSGLTLYWNQDVLTGMVSYGPGGHPVTVGWCTGLAKYVPLAQGEHFTSLWLRLSGLRKHFHAADLLTFTTNTGRSHHCGPDELATPRLTPGSLSREWRRLSCWDGPAKMTGILVNDRDADSTDAFVDMGVIDEPSSEGDPLAETALPTLESVARGPFEGTFARTRGREPKFHRTTGSLRDVVCVQVRRDPGGRCLGMRVAHSGGPDDFLGSWDPRDVSGISTIYGGRSASTTSGDLVEPLAGLHFFFGTDTPVQVKDIRACVASSCASHRGMGNGSGASSHADPRNQPSAFSPRANTMFFPVGSAAGPGTRLAWRYSSVCDELRSYEPGTPVPILSGGGIKGRRLVWEPPRTGETYRLKEE